MTAASSADHDGMSLHESTAPTPTFVESGAPPAWLRVLLWGSLLLAGGAGASVDLALAALLVAILLCFLVLPLELSQRRYGGVCVEDGRIHVGRRSAPVSGLDLDSVRAARPGEAFGVFDRSLLATNPMWLKHSLSIPGTNDDGDPIRVAVRTNHPEELLAALRVR
jgi:hypothetical protein